MPTRQAQKLSYRVDKVFSRHFDRHARDVLVYRDPTKSDCTDCAVAGPLGSSIDANCTTCSGKGYILQDSSACLTAIVVSAEPRQSVRFGVVEHNTPASFHANSFIVVFKLSDTVLDPIRYPDQSIFETTGYSKIRWGKYFYSVKSYARDGIGAEENYMKVFVEKTED